MKTRYLLLVLFGAGFAILALSQARHAETAAAPTTPTPSPALLDAMNSHGIATVTDAEADPAEAPAMQAAVYHGGTTP